MVALGYSCDNEFSSVFPNYVIYTDVRTSYLILFFSLEHFISVEDGLHRGKKRKKKKRNF